MDQKREINGRFSVIHCSQNSTATHIITGRVLLQPSLSLLGVSADSGFQENFTIDGCGENDSHQNFYASGFMTESFRHLQWVCFGISSLHHIQVRNRCSQITQCCQIGSGDVLIHYINVYLSILLSTVKSS